MKSIDLFCASQASTAICSSMDRRAMVRHGTRPIDDHRRNHQIGDRRIPKNIHPNPYYQKSDSFAGKQSREEIVPRKSSPNINDDLSTIPPGSTRYLPSDTVPFIDFVSDSDHLSALVVSQPVILGSNNSLADPVKSQLVVSQRPHNSNNSSVLKSSSARSRSCYQVVELMVSIHCKGCEEKVRKHISRMEGMVDKVKKDGKRKRITEGDSVKCLKKFARKGKKYSKKDNQLVIHGDKKPIEVQMDSDFDVPVVHTQKIIPTEKILKIWDLYYQECNRNFNGKIIYWCDMNVPNIIMQKLNQSQLEKFKTSCFGKFLDFGEHQMYSQIIHHALLREVHQRDDGEMWFLFGEKRVRFGLPEFCLISGLRWQGEDDISAYKGMENLLVEKFFGDEALTRSSIGRVYQDAVFDDDDDAVRMSMIMLVFNFILSTVADNYVDGAMINFLCFGDVNRYPWGKVAFEQTKYSLSNALKGRLKKGTNGGWIYNFYKEHYTKSYKLNGLAYVFQVFLFETILTFKARGICNDEHPSDVRLFRWKELVKPPTNENLNDMVFGSGQLRVKSLIPTVDEKNRLDLGGVHFFNGNEGDNKVEKNVDVEDVGFSISDVKDAIDARFRPLEKKVSEIKKDIRKLRGDIRDEMENLHSRICKDVRLIIREELRWNKGDGDNDDKKDDGGADSDDDGGDEADDADLDASKLIDNNDGGDRLKVVEKNDENEIENVNEVERDATVEEPHEIKSNDDEENVKIDKKNDMPSFDILSQYTGKDIVVYVASEGDKCEVESRSVLDEMVLTTQDIEHCVEIERSAHKTGGRPVREPAKSVVLRSPYTTKFGSAGSSSTIMGDSEIPAGRYAFPKVCMAMPSKYEEALFDQWFKIGLNNRKRTNKFPGNNDNIEPAFIFGAIPIASKMWFYKLKTPGQWLDDDHINIAFYYLRKLARHSDSVQIRATTTDCWFHGKMNALFEEYTSKNADKSILSGEGDVAEYIRGLFMDVNTPWVNVDYVLFPINMSSPDHWFLLTFDVHRRRLTVYNSLQPNRKTMQTKIMDVCEPYIFMLPAILRKSGFWRDRSDINFSSEPYCNKDEDDIIDLEFADGVPEQADGDCGMFTICFAEHVIHQKFAEIPNPFPIPQYRKKLCTNLYMHARNKQLEGYETDREFPGRFVPDFDSD